MNILNRTRAERSTLSIVVAVTAILLPASAVPPAHARAFGSADSQVSQVFCDMTTVQGRFTAAAARYSSGGVCVQTQSPQKPDDKATNTSEFPRVQESKEIFRANWTAQGTYDPVTKETWEKVTLPAPRVDEKTPVGRPYGNYETRMICATDPWLTGTGVNCTGKKVVATGNLGDMEAALRNINRPVTTPNKAPQLQALNDTHDRWVRQHTITTANTSRGPGVMAQLMAPTLAEPAPGSTHRPQTPMRIRVTPAKGAKDVSYELEFQFRAAANADWRLVTHVPVNAAQAQSALGYKGWGGHADGTGPQMTAALGLYRLRVRTISPSRSEPSEWVEFRVDGQPATLTDVAGRGPSRVTSPPGVVQLDTRAPVPASAPQVTPGTGLNRRGEMVQLNPQPLPPQQGPQWGAATSPSATLKPRGEATRLNPQPLPPAGMPTQAPGTFR